MLKLRLHYGYKTFNLIRWPISGVLKDTIQDSDTGVRVSFATNTECSQENMMNYVRAMERFIAAASESDAALLPDSLWIEVCHVPNHDCEPADYGWSWWRRKVTGIESIKFAGGIEGFSDLTVAFATNGDWETLPKRVLLSPGALEVDNAGVFLPLPDGENRVCGSCGESSQRWLTLGSDGGSDKLPPPDEGMRTWKLGGNETWLGAAQLQSLVIPSGSNVLSCYVPKNASYGNLKPSVGYIYDDFAGTSLRKWWVSITNGGGAVTVSGGGVRLNTSAAAADAAAICSQIRIPAHKVFRHRERFKVTAVTAGSSSAFILTQKDGVWALNSRGDTVIYVSMDTSNVLHLGYYNHLGVQTEWVGATNAWGAGVQTSYTGAFGTIYRIQIDSTATSWQLTLLDDNGVALETCDAVNWNATRDITYYGAMGAGDALSTINQQDMTIYSWQTDYPLTSYGSVNVWDDGVYEGWVRLWTAITAPDTETVLVGWQVAEGENAIITGIQLDEGGVPTRLMRWGIPGHIGMPYVEFDAGNAVADAAGMMNTTAINRAAEWLASYIGSVDYARDFWQHLEVVSSAGAAGVNPTRRIIFLEESQTGMLRLGYRDAAGTYYWWNGDKWRSVYVFDNFTTAAAAPTAPLVEAVAGAGNVVIASGECQIDTSGAQADGAIVYLNSALPADKIWRIRTRFRCPTITHIAATILSLTDKAAAPAISAGGAGTGGGTTEIWITQNTAGGITIRYWDNVGGNKYWDGAAWAVAGTAYAGTVGTTYRVDVVSNATSWYVALYDANDVLLEQTDAITWAATRAIANSLWVFSGDDDTTNYQSNVYLDYMYIDDQYFGRIMRGERIKCEIETDGTDWWVRVYDTNDNLLVDTESEDVAWADTYATAGNDYISTGDVYTASGSGKAIVEQLLITHDGWDLYNGIPYRRYDRNWTVIEAGDGAVTELSNESGFVARERGGVYLDYIAGYENVQYTPQATLLFWISPLFASTLTGILTHTILGLGSGYTALDLHYDVTAGEFQLDIEAAEVIAISRALTAGEWIPCALKIDALAQELTLRIGDETVTETDVNLTSLGSTSSVHAGTFRGENYKIAFTGWWNSILTDAEVAAWIRLGRLPLTVGLAGPWRESLYMTDGQTYDYDNRWVARYVPGSELGRGRLRIYHSGTEEMIWLGVGPISPMHSGWFEAELATLEAISARSSLDAASFGEFVRITAVALSTWEKAFTIDVSYLGAWFRNMGRWKVFALCRDNAATPGVHKVRVRDAVYNGAITWDGEWLDSVGVSPDEVGVWKWLDCGELIWPPQSWESDTLGRIPHDDASTLQLEVQINRASGATTFDIDTVILVPTQDYGIGAIPTPALWTSMLTFDGLMIPKVYGSNLRAEPTIVLSVDTSYATGLRLPLMRNALIRVLVENTTNKVSRSTYSLLDLAMVGHKRLFT